MAVKGKLLIVDDELSVRDSLHKWFREEGYEVHVAEDANEALTRMAETKFDPRRICSISDAARMVSNCKNGCTRSSGNDCHHDDRICLCGNGSAGAQEWRLRLCDEAA